MLLLTKCNMNIQNNSQNIRTSHLRISNMENNNNMTMVRFGMSSLEMYVHNKWGPDAISSNLHWKSMQRAQTIKQKS